MRKLVLLMAACLSLGSIAFAQVDPGNPDSIIIGDAHVDSNGTFAFVPIWAVTDDSVAFYNLPLAWHAPLGGVHGSSGTQYFYPLTSWDERYDTLMISEGYFRMLGWCELNTDTLHPYNPPMHTNGQRQHIMTVRFNVDPNTRSQLVILDTTFDDRNHSLTFGLTDGLTEIRPQFQKGFISVGVVGVDEPTVMPVAYNLAQNYPNPFNPETNIEFSLPKDQDANLVVFNLLGQRVRTLVDGHLGAGNHTAHWDGKNESGGDVPSGIYFYRLYTSEFSQTNKMVLVR
jgi:hypothetical protein